MPKASAREGKEGSTQALDGAEGQEFGVDHGGTALPRLIFRHRALIYEP
jgi:hypothetical protein